MAGGGCLASGQSPARRASDWPQQGYDAGGTFFKPTGDPPTTTPAVVWEASVSAVDRRSYLDFPHVLVADGTVYTSGGTALSLDRGTEQAQTPCYQRSLKAFARTDSHAEGVLVAKQLNGGLSDSEALERSFGSETDTIRGVRPSLGSGSACADQTRWTARTPADTAMPVVDLRVSHGEIVAAVDPRAERGDDDHGLLLGLDADDGSVNWRTELSRDPDRLCVDEDYIYLHYGLLWVGDERYGDADRHEDVRGLFVALDRETGEVVYDGIPDEEGTITRPEDPVFHGVRDGVAYIVEYEHLDEEPHFAPHLVAFDVAASEPKWRIDATEYENYQYQIEPADGVEGGITAAIGPDTVFVVFPSGIRAFSTADGSLRWEHQGWTGQPTVTPDGVYAAFEDRVLCLDPETGETMWSGRIPVPDGDYLGTPVAADSKLLIPRISRGAREESTLFALEEP